MVDTITIPGTKAKIPVWFGVLVGALVLVIATMRGKPEEEEPEIPQYGVDLLAAELNARLREQYQDFLSLIQYYLSQPQGPVEPPGEADPGPVAPPEDWECEEDPSLPGCDYYQYPPGGEPGSPPPVPIMPPTPYPVDPGIIPGYGGIDPIGLSLDLAETFSPVTVARSLYETYRAQKPGNGIQNRKPFYNIGDTFTAKRKGGSPGKKRTGLRLNDHI